MLFVVTLYLKYQFKYNCLLKSADLFSFPVICSLIIMISCIFQGLTKVKQNPLESYSICSGNAF